MEIKNGTKWIKTSSPLILHAYCPQMDQNYFCPSNTYVDQNPH